MCRLSGYVAHAPITLAQPPGEADLYVFAELAGKHGDVRRDSLAVSVRSVTDVQAAQ
jgi:hypothetical protein